MYIGRQGVIMYIYACSCGTGHLGCALEKKQESNRGAFLLFLKDLFICLKELQRCVRRHRERFHLLFTSSPNGCNGLGLGPRARACQSEGPRVLSGSSICVTGTHIPGPSSAAFPDHCQGASLEVEQLGCELVSQL